MQLRLPTVAMLTVALCLPAAAQEEKGPKTPLDIVKERQAEGRKRTRSKIILGTAAKAGTYPFQVSIFSASAEKGEEFSGHTCGGTLISDLWVLTAGHCVTSSGEVSAPEDLNVYIGSIDFKKGDRIPVKTVIRHPKYLTEFTENDVALLQLARKPKAGTKYSVVKLIEPANEAALTRAGTAVTIIGWGTTEEGDLSQSLRESRVQMVESAECNKGLTEKRIGELDEYLATAVRKLRISPQKMNEVRDAFVRNAGQLITDAMICAGEPKSTEARVRDTCQGDSGGPLLAKGPDGFVQVGIVSWGEGCGVPKLHGVYTRLAKFTDWVKATAK